MSDFLHMDLPLDDAAMKEIAKYFGFEWQKPDAETVSPEKVEVCPMSPPTGSVGFMELRYDKHGKS